MMSKNGHKMGTFSSRKRGAPCAVTEGANEVDDGHLVDAGTNEKEQDSFWREKYEAIKNDRSESLDDTNKELNILKKKEVEYKRCIKLLEEKLAGASPKDNKVSPTIASSDVNTVPTPAQDDSSNELESCRDKIKFYELATGMHIQLQHDGVTLCTVKNKRKRIMTKFTISEQHPVDNSSSTHTLAYHPKANVSLLPEYLKTETSFPSELAPALCGDVLGAMFDD